MELPARFGIKTALKVLRQFFCFSGLLMLFISNKAILITTLIFISTNWLFLEALTIRFKKTEPYLIGYLGHRYLIFTTSFYLNGLLLLLEFPLAGVVILLLILSIFQPSYMVIPGKKISIPARNISKKKAEMNDAISV